MAGSLCIRCPLVAALAASACLLLEAEAAAAEGVVWLADHAAAAAQARKQGKMLLVVHLSGDFARSDASSAEARLYRTLTLDDPRVARVLKDRFVVTYRHVGEPRSLSRIDEASPRPAKRPKSAKSSVPSPAEPAPVELAITYVCLPDERVLHYVPGFLATRELLAELRWVEEGYAESVKLRESDTPFLWRQWHQATVGRSDWSQFQDLFESRWKDRQLARGSSTVDLPPAIAAARTTLERSLAVRLPAARPMPALAGHGVLGVESAHLVLAEFPLIALADLARPVYEDITGQRFWEATPRRTKLAAWWTDCRRRKLATLLVVKDDTYHLTLDDGSTAPFTWPPPDAKAITDVPRLETQVVSLDELAQLAADADLEPVTFAAANGQPRYLLHDARGFRCAQLMVREATVEKLAEAIRSAVGPASIAGGGAREVRE